jgi:MerR family transcriptional regulator, copper efflux regulator
VIERIRKKMGEIERKKHECEQILETLGWMLEYRIALTNDPQKAESLLRLRHGEQAARSPDATAANS